MRGVLGDLPLSSLRFGDVVVVEVRGAVVVVAGNVVVVRGTVVVVFGIVVVVSTTVVVVSGIVVVVSTTVVVVSGVGVSTRLTIGSGAPLPTLAAVTRRVISVELMPGTAWVRRAARPATCGDAIDVPEMVFFAPLPPIHAEVMPLPGAHASTQLP